MDAIEKWICDHHPRRVGIQFSAIYACHSALIVKHISSVLERCNCQDSKLFCLVADANQGECLDLKHAAHYAADMILHIDQACNYCNGEIRPSNTFRISLDSVLARANACLASPILSDGWRYRLEEQMSQIQGYIWFVTMERVLYDQLSESFKDAPGEETRLWFSDLSGGLFSNNGRHESFLRHQTDEDCDWSVTMIVIGNDKADMRIRQITQRYNRCIKESFFVSPDNAEMRPMSKSNMATTRYPLLDKHANFARIGIIFSQNLSEEQNRCRAFIKAQCWSKERIVTQICLHPVTEVKIENFPDCHCFCIIGCPSQTQRLIENKDLHRRPIFTPNELLIMLGVKEWSSHFILDLAEVTAGIILEPKNLGLDDSEADEEVQSVVSRASNPLMLTFHKGVIPINKHSFQGVPFANPTPVQSKILEGKHGVASKYDGEGIKIT